MGIKFYDTEKAISKFDFENIEKILTFRLPEEYKTHLLMYNGGRCKPNIFSFIEEGKISKSSIDWFLAIYEGKYDNLNTYINMYKFEQKRIPFYLVPIAHDAGGSLICISCSESDYGYIYFWDHEKEQNHAHTDYWGNIYLIDKSFNRFITNLKFK